MNPNLTKEQRQEILQLLFEFKDVFARNLYEMKRYPHYQLEVETISNRTSYRRQYKLSQADEDEIERQIEQMKDIGVITEAQDCFYNSPVFLVAKRDGSKRLVQDLRAINELIIPKTIQLPKIPELISSILEYKPRYWNSYDLKAGYWQVPLGVKSRSLTAFTSPKLSLIHI